MRRVIAGITVATLAGIALWFWTSRPEAQTTTATVPSEFQGAAAGAYTRYASICSQAPEYGSGGSLACSYAGPNPTIEIDQVKYVFREPYLAAKSAGCRAGLIRQGYGPMYKHERQRVVAATSN